MDRKYVLTGLGYALLGLLLGIHMAATKNHGQLVTHAHIMLLGFVVSMIYAMMHKLWLTDGNSKLAIAQYWLHQAGTAVLTIGLYCLYGGIAGDDALAPVLGISSIVVLISLILMKVMYIKSSKSTN